MHQGNLDAWLLNRGRNRSKEKTLKIVYVLILRAEID